MKSYYNIETRLISGKRVGYAKSGHAIRIYGDSSHGYTANGKYCRNLAEVSEYLSTLDLS